MARRIYGKNSKSDMLKSKTLQQIRDLRSNLDPAMLEKIAAIVSENTGLVPQPAVKKQNSEVKVDKKKNRETVLQALSLRDNASLDFLKGIEKLVSENKL